MIEKLKFYCQKVLPLVYDESLSYYEVICKVAKTVNDLICFNKELCAEWEKFRDEFSTNINDTVREILNQWAIDGTLETIINDEIFGKINADINTLENEMNELKKTYEMFKNQVIEENNLFMEKTTKKIVNMPVNSFSALTNRRRFVTYPLRWDNTPAVTNTPTLGGIAYVNNVLYSVYYFTDGELVLMKQPFTGGLIREGEELLHENGHANSLEVIDNGKALLIATTTKDVICYDIATRHVTHITAPVNVSGLALDKENDILYVSGSGMLYKMNYKDNQGHYNLTILKSITMPTSNQINQGLGFYKGLVIAPLSQPTTLAVYDDELNFMRNISASNIGGEIEDLTVIDECLFAGVNVGNPLLNNNKKSYIFEVDILGKNLYKDLIKVDGSNSPVLDLTGNIDYTVPTDDNDLRIYLRDGIFTLPTGNEQYFPLATVLDYLIIKGYCGLKNGNEIQDFCLMIPAMDTQSTHDDIVRPSITRRFFTEKRIRWYSFGIHISKTDNPWIDVQEATVTQIDGGTGTVTFKSGEEVGSADIHITNISGIKKSTFSF